ncbi:hypothetical protein FB45DRAFT_1137784, partial [Roridomyces roridus]
MSSLPQPPCIPSNPDISGIGVRTAIYIQNLLGFIPAISALWDGEVAAYELEAIETQSSTILITGFGMLIAAVVEAGTGGLSIFHTNVILALSWMSNTNTFIYLLLYVQRRSQLGPRRLWADLLGWRRWFAKNESKEPTNSENEQRSILRSIFRVQVSGVAIIAILGSLHLSMMSAV